MNSDLRASLLDLGFNLSQARAAVAAGNTTVESATEWIFANNEAIPPSQAAAPSQADSNTLRLRTGEDDTFDADLQRALAESTKSAPTPSPSIQPSQDHQQDHQPPTDDASSTQQLESSPKKIKINIFKAPTASTTPATSSVIAPLPLTSRHNEQEAEAQNATRLSEANKRAEKVKRDKMEARIARQRALDALKEDRENRKLRNQNPAPTSSTGASSDPPLASTVQEPAIATVTPVASAPSNAMVQLRMKNGSVLKRSFQSTATVKDLFDLTRSEDRNIGNADISLIQPFPRREFTVRDSGLTLSEAGLCPSCSLNVLVQTPILAPQPVTPNPGAWIPSSTGPDSQGPTPMDIDQDAGTVHYLPHFGNSGQDDNDDDDEENEDEEEEVEGGDNDDGEDEADENEDADDDEIMHALPVIDHINPNHPFAIPGLGRGRGRGRGHGRGGMPFSGAGHSLSSSGPVSATNDQDPDQPEMTPEERDQQRRQRVLEAMTSRAKAQEADKNTLDLTVGAKRVKGREIPSLQSLCCYQVAVMLTAKDSKSNTHLKLWGEHVGSQIGEAVIQELIRLKQLDQLTFKRFYTCPIVNMVLDAYSRATDSLMDVIGGSQARSLAYLSLKECTFLTDTGFRNIARFELLELLDLSHCRITDKTLAFTLNLPYLSTLNLSATKVTTAGLARVIADAEWKSNLQTLDLSYCQGIAGPLVLYNLQELERLRTLKLNSSKAFNMSPVRIPDSKAFSHLLNLDLASTSIDAPDLIALLPSVGTVEKLNLTSCTRVTTEALEQIVSQLKMLQDLKFPSRNHHLTTVLPTASVLPLTHLDLSDFKFIADEAILSLAEAKNLQMLSLSGTMLTDAGSAVLVHMSSLKELSLDRTHIGDKSMEYLRDLGRIEILSLSQVMRLTTVGVNHLGRSAFFSLKLKRLNLKNNPFIHDEALAVFSHCNSLNTLNLDNTDVTEIAALRLQDSLSNLTQLRIQGVTNGEIYQQNPRALLTNA
ncbi:hypothetical protein BGZ96_011519 [Linnemannia gamsii]|uniref:RNI-like protein n=1 Tax=Linnemannia gamsii TaxID=64522 RepID=A0ABQ7JST4_9FUNG|nr:hypothetical protein BGZ96_011519 [Linnemannia gamsii]